MNRFANITASVLRRSQRATLATSQSKHNFFQKLKENIAEEQSSDEKFKEAQRKAKLEMENIGKEYDPLLQKSKKISEDSMSEAQKTIKMAKEKLEQQREKLAEKAQSNEFLKKAAPNLKFSMKIPQGMDPRQWEEIKRTSEAAELLGQGFFGVLDTDPSYKRPLEPRMRHPEWLNEVYSEDTDTTGVDVHSSSKWNKRVESFNESGLGQRMANFKAKMEDSDSSVMRGARMFMWKIKESASMNRETSLTIEEIQRMEKNWEPAQFCEVLESDFLPNILEAACQGDEDVVEDWCTEKASGVLLSNKRLAAKQGLSYQKHIYSLSNIEFMDASIDEETDFPTVMISFSTQEIHALINGDGVLVDGSLDKPFSNQHIYVFARDMAEMNPRAAWRLIECQSAGKEMTF